MIRVLWLILIIPASMTAGVICTHWWQRIITKRGDIMDIPKNCAEGAYTNTCQAPHYSEDGCKYEKAIKGGENYG